MMGGHTTTAPYCRVADFVRRFHIAYDGSFPEASTTLGPSSYALLADQVPVKTDTDAPVVVDLGCGAARLLEILTDRGLPPSALIGIDFSEDQITRAQDRLGETPIRLFGSASNHMPLGDASVDCVLVHMALAVMVPVEATLREIERVLKPGGVFAAVMENQPIEGTIEGHYNRILRDTAARYDPTLPRFSPVDTPEPEQIGIIDQTQACTGLQAVGAEQPFELLMQMTRDDYLEFIKGDYLFEGLQDAARKDVSRAVSHLFDRHGDNRVTIPLAMQLVVFRKPLSDGRLR